MFSHIRPKDPRALISVSPFTSCIFYSVVLRASRITLMHYFDTRTHHHNITPNFITKSNPVSDTLKTKKTKCTEAGANPGSLQMPDSKRATGITRLLRCLFLSASETGLLLVVKLRHNVVIMCTGVKILHQVLREFHSK